MITKKYYKLIRVSYADEGYFCLTNVSNSVGNVKLNKNSGTDANYEYSTDGATWNAYTVSSDVQVDPNSNIYWRYAGSGDNINGNYTFVFDFDCNASGNLMSMFSKTDFASYTGNWRASELFRNQTHLLRADFNLGGVTDIPGFALQNIFMGCTSLTAVPDLSKITTVGDYGMNTMFSGCTALATPPDLSSVTTVGNDGMNTMFSGCTALATPPDLSSVTTVGNNGMNTMFINCSSLTTGPNLSKITSLGSQGMGSMFFNNNSMSTAYAPTITWDTTKTYNWLVSSYHGTGTLYADASIASTIPTNNNSGCPANWNVVTI